MWCQKDTAVVDMRERCIIVAVYLTPGRWPEGKPASDKAKSISTTNSSRGIPDTLEERKCFPINWKRRHTSVENKYIEAGFPGTYEIIEFRQNTKKKPGHEMGEIASPAIRGDSASGRLHPDPLPAWPIVLTSGKAVEALSVCGNGHGTLSTPLIWEVVCF